MRRHADGRHAARTYARFEPREGDRDDARQHRHDASSSATTVPPLHAPRSRAPPTRAGDGRPGLRRPRLLLAQRLGRRCPTTRCCSTPRSIARSDAIDQIETESGADLAGVSWETEVIGAAPARAIAARAPRARRGRDHRRHPRLRPRPRAARQRRPRADPSRRLPDHRDPRARRRPPRDPRDGRSRVMSYEDSPFPLRDAVTPPPPPDTRWLQTPVRAFMRPGVVTVAEDASLHPGAARDGRPRRPCRPDHSRRRAARLGDGRRAAALARPRSRRSTPPRPPSAETVAYIPPGASAREALQALSAAGVSHLVVSPRTARITAGRGERDRPRATRVRRLIRSASAPALRTRPDGTQPGSADHGRMPPTPLSVPGPIVVGVERSERSRDALALARTLARAVGTRADPRRRLSRRRPLGGHAAPAPTRPPWPRRLRRRSNGSARPLGGVRPSSRAVPCTSVTRGLQQVAEEEDALAIVVGPSHRGALGQVVPGSVGERLLHGAPCPVAVAPRGYWSDAVRGIRASASASSRRPRPTRRCAPPSGSRCAPARRSARSAWSSPPAGVTMGFGWDYDELERNSRATISPQSLVAHARRRHVAGRNLR